MDNITVAQRVLGCLLILGSKAEPEFKKLREEFDEPEKIPGSDTSCTDAFRVLYGGGLCDFEAFDLRTKGEYHDAVVGLVDFCRKPAELRRGVQGGLPEGEDVPRLLEQVQLCLEAGVKELIRERDKSEVSLKLTELVSKLNTGTISPQEAGSSLIETAQKVKPAEAVVTWSTYLDRAGSLMEEALRGGPELKSGLTELDRKLMFRRANLTTIAARTSHGKSAFCLHMAKCALKAGLKVGYWCGEDYHVFPYLFAGSMFGCPVKHLTRFHEATIAERGQAETCMSLARQYEGLLHVYPAVSLQEFDAQTRDVKPDVLVFDYVQKYAEQFGNDDMRRSTSKATSNFQDIVRRSNAFGFMACQVKRGEGQYRPSRENAPPQSLEPSLYDLKESGDIENYSDAVLILHWPWRVQMDESANELDKEDYRITIAKDKLGPCGSARVRFSGPTLTFSNRYTMGA